MTKTRAAKLRAKKVSRSVLPGTMVYGKQSRRMRMPREIDYQLSPEFEYFGSKNKLSRFIPIPPRNRGLTVQPVTVPRGAGDIINRNGFQPFITTLNNSTLITNTELIYDVNTAPLNVDVRIAMIPGETAWVDGIAKNFSKWQLRYLRYIYIPTCNASTNGYIVMSPGYDHFDVIPLAPAQLQRGFRSVTAPVWAGWEGASCLHSYGVKMAPGAVAIEIDVCEFKSGNELSKYPYISNPIFQAANGVTKNLYSPGYLDFIVTSSVSGELFCQYQYELFEPIDPVVNPDV